MDKKRYPNGNIVKSGIGILRKYLGTLVLTLIFVVFVRSFIVQAYEIPSGSMIPSIVIGDRLLADKIVYRFRAPERGEIVIFKNPLDESKVPLIKRVIGLPGDKLEIRNRELFINGQKIDESGYVYYETFDERLGPRDNLGPITIPKSRYFMMGDNRDNSNDSRYWGFVPEENLVGRAFMIWMNWDSAAGGVGWERIGDSIN